MKRATVNSIDFEIKEQDLVAQAGAGVANKKLEQKTASQLTAEGRCGLFYTISFECQGGGFLRCR